MRFVMTAVLALTMSLSAFAAHDDKAVTPAPGTTPVAADSKAINDVCAACGMAVNAKIAPVAATTKDGKKVLIGTCSEGCEKKVAGSPEKFVDAAIAGKKADKVEEKTETKAADGHAGHDHK
ncbi:MAG: hypothetical protein H0V44_02110 [Planctomycetes bacterium]|nr:hypothetical protein [Planctomycetota bacterium]